MNIVQIQEAHADNVIWSIEPVCWLLRLSLHK